MVTITFEVTKGKTIMIATGSTGIIEKIDITGTDAEKQFTLTMKKVKEIQIVKQIEDAINIDTYKES